ncbi:MAG: translation initiation factor IF-3 [Candidatus Marinimicrobia bacterium]|nr:translation initiation factor IF-3 [Candidatus Neomarinimicrobiota bacterium]
MRKRRNTGDTRVNFGIKAKEVRLIDNNGDQIGIVDRQTAFDRADKVGLDLVEVAPNAKPPVCKIMDFGKYKYKQQQKEKKKKQNQQKVKVKELRFSTRIEEHDIKTKIRKAKSFLEDNNKVKLSLMFKGRENIHAEIGFELIQDLISRLEEEGEVDKPPKKMGSLIQTTIKPKN